MYVSKESYFSARGLEAIQENPQEDGTYSRLREFFVVLRRCRLQALASDLRTTL